MVYRPLARKNICDVSNFPLILKEPTMLRSYQVYWPPFMKITENYLLVNYVQTYKGLCR